MQLAAQERPAFEVISIKRTAPGANGGGFQNSPGQFMTRNYGIKALLVLAYGGSGYQIVGAPAWVDSERYDITAKLPLGDVTPEQRRQMIRTLLADRFKLQTHREPLEIPAYSMVLARNDKKLGPALHPSTLDCTAIRAKGAAGGVRVATPEQMMLCNFFNGGGADGPRRLRAQGVSIAELALMLRNFVDRPVFDDSGLPGGFDLDLSFLPVLQAGPGTQSDAPSILTALQEQLGLKLESARRTIDALVIDRIERPDEN